MEDEDFTEQLTKRLKKVRNYVYLFWYLKNFCSIINWSFGHLGILIFIWFLYSIVPIIRSIIMYIVYSW